MVTVEFDFMGEAVRLALVAERYEDGGLAVLLLDATDPRSEVYMSEWGVLTVNVPGATGPGRIAIAADMPDALVDALAATEVIESDGRPAASGMAKYRTAAVSGWAMDKMGNRLDTLEEALGSTVVVEYESGGEGGAFEVGTAPAGSVEIDRLVAEARSEANGLAYVGGWAAVRIGFGDIESIDCETGRTVYIAGTE